MNKIVIMYHSISSQRTPAVIGSFPMAMERFQAQINLLQEKGFRFDFISNIHKNSIHDKIAYITGDDGTIDWSRNVLPWCEKHKIPTHTGIITGALEKQPIYPLTHIIQVILSIRERSELVELSNHIQKEHLTEDEKEYIEKIYYYESETHRKFIKGAFNLIFDVEKSYALLGELHAKEREYLKNRFESLDYYKKFHYAEVGVHTRKHYALGIETQSYIEDEIYSCEDFLRHNGISPTKIFVSPMKPKYGATLHDIVPELKKHGYSAILDSNEGLWNGEDFIIPRVDGKNVETFLAKYF